MAYGAKEYSGKKKSNYHQYFEGYSDIPMVTSSGATKIEKVYTAPYWVHDLTDEQWKHRKLSFGALSLMAVVLYLLASFMPLGNNHSLMVILPSGLTLAAMVFFLTSTFTYLTCPRKMTIYQHNHSSAVMRRWPLLTAVGMAVTALMSMVYLFVSGDRQWLSVLGCACCYLAAAAAAYTIYRIECRTEYYEEENDSGYGIDPRSPF